VEVLKEKVLALFEEFFGFFSACAYGFPVRTCTSQTLRNQMIRLRFVLAKPGPTLPSFVDWDCRVPASNCQKDSRPLRKSPPPFRPSLTAAGSFFFGKIQRVYL
jgi:hypothetical protein